MAFPRRCKHCRCFTAPHLKRCPRCDKVVPSNVVIKLTKEEKQAERVKLDADVPVIHRKNMQWVPSALSIRCHQQLLDEVRDKLKRADTAHERNVLRSEIRCIKTTLNKTASDAKRRWTTELFRAKHASIHVFISPKGKRYVGAESDRPADLIIKNGPKASTPLSRLQLFEKSPYFKMQQADAKQDKIHKKRKKSKKERRLKKKKSPTLS